MSEFFGLSSGDGNRVPLAAFVENIDRDTVRVCAAPGFSLALFKAPAQPLQIAVTGDDDTWMLSIRQPAADETISVHYPSSNVIEIKYGR